MVQKADLTWAAVSAAAGGQSNEIVLLYILRPTERIAPGNAPARALSGLPASVTVSMASIAPALLAADFARLGQALEVIGASGASRVHIDVIDGHFRPEITVGGPPIASPRGASGQRTLDANL